MMILDNVSLPSAGTTAQDKPVRTSSGGSASSVPIATNNGAAEIETTNAVTASSGTQTLNAINSNTYVVKLEPQPENGTTNRAPKTNLLQLFSENGKGKNLSIVRALGIGRIVVNRTSLKNGREKPSQRPAPFSGNNLNIGLTRTPIFVRAAPQISHVSRREDKTTSSGKRDDDISDNLANFMNFKLTGLVPSPLMKSEVGKNTFEINMKPPEARLPKQDDKQVPGKPDTTLSLSPLKTRPTSPEPKDDDLTSLSWLINNDTNLLKTISSWNPDDAGISLSGDDTDEEEDDDVASNKSNAVFTAKSKVECGSQGGFATRQYGQPYSPNGKPPYSFSCLIFMAVEDSQDKMLPVKEIYAWVCKHFPYFETAPSGWKNSIRHNLSLNKCFKKADQGRHSHDPGKGSLWCIDPAYRPNLIQALKRTPFYPYLYPSGIGQPLSLNNLASLLPGVKAGRVPLWSPSMTQSTSSWTDPDVASAALNLMGLKGNEAADRSANVRSTLQELAAEIFNQNDDVAGTIPLVITDPADDHTYSISFAKPKNEIDGERCLSPNSDKSAPDAAYEFETPGTDLDSDVEVEEQLSVDGSDTECELADSGFAGLKGRERNRNKGKRKKSSRSLSPVTLKSKRTRSSGKSTQSSSKRGLKVRFQHKKKTKTTSPGAKKLKRKITPQEGDDGLTSDADSGKDSPKVQSKSRRRTPAKIKPPPTKKAKKTTHFKPSHTSPYGTRSTKQTRHSKRIGAFEHGNILERASARRRKQDSVSADTDDEEIKLAAGSLLHLAGFRSPP